MHLDPDDPEAYWDSEDFQLLEDASPDVLKLYLDWVSRLEYGEKELADNLRGAINRGATPFRESILKEQLLKGEERATSLDLLAKRLTNIIKEGYQTKGVPH